MTRDVPRAFAPVLFAAAVSGLGVLLISGRLVNVWAPIPESVSGRHAIACAAGALMLLSAAGLSCRKTAALSSAILTCLFALWLVLLQTPRLVGAPSRELLWSGAAQIVSIVAGGWVLFASAAPNAEGAWRWLGGARAVQLARALYAVALPMFGLHHFFSGPAAVEVVPAWLPFRIGWVYLTGVAHMVAGIAILLGIVPRVAATLEAIMVSAFVLLVHVPGVIAAPRDALQWTMLVVASVIGGAAWVVARSYAERVRARGPLRAARGSARQQARRRSTTSRSDA